MGWVRLDDGFAEDPVIANLSDSAFALWVASIAYSNRQLTDGFVPLQVGYGGLRYCGGNAVPYVRELEHSGRWEPVDGGWKIHAYLDWQRSKATILGEREVTKDRVARHRNEDGNDVTNGVANGVGNTSKEPQPQPQPQQEFTHFYAAYPRRVGRRAAERAFTSACKRADANLIIEAAAKLAADPNLPPLQYVPYPSTWLNRDGWLDDPLPPRSNGRVRGSVGNLLALADEVERR